MEIDFGSLIDIKQEIPVLLDIDGNQVSDSCQVSYDLEFA